MARAELLSHILAGMYLWIKLPEQIHMGDLEFCQQLVRQTGVAVSPGSGFGPGGKGYIRFALVQPEEALVAAAAEVGRFLSELHPDSMEKS
jgi:aspartate/methionine/tyrosine aminotransferase